MRYCLGILVFCLCWTSGRADWPGFLGPGADGRAVGEKGLMKTWPAEGPKTLWTVPVGPGFSGTAIFQGQVYLLDRENDQKDVLRCLDLKTGTEAWRADYDAPGKLDYNGSRSTPAVTQATVTTIGPFGNLTCFDRKTHQILWKKQLIQDFGAKLPRWGSAQSPALYKDLVIAATVGDQAGAIACKQATGEVVWKSAPLKGQLAYVSPRTGKIAGVEQAVIMTTEQTAGIDLRDGKVLWTYDWSLRNPIPSPTLLAGDRILLAAEYGAGCAMIRVEKKDGGFTVSEVFKTKECQPQLHQPLLHEDRLYFNSNGNSFRAGLLCMDLDGKVLWKTGNAPNFEKGNLILADNMIYILDGDKGELYLVKPDPAGYKELAKAKVLETKQAWAPMSIADGKLLLRDQKQLKCLDVRGK